MLETRSPISERPVRRPGRLVETRVYLASRFARQQALIECALELEELGASVVSSWLRNSNLDSADFGSERSATLAAADLEDLRHANTLVAFTEEASGQQGRGGRHVEFGAALALGLRVIIVGPREHIFHCLPGVEQYDSWEVARDALLKPRGDCVRP